jgi:hypothetical protein
MHGYFKECQANMFDDCTLRVVGMVARVVDWVQQQVMQDC